LDEPLQIEVCKRCGGPLKRSGLQFCSRQCWYEHAKQSGQCRTGSIRTWYCVQCGKECQEYTNKKRYVRRFCGRTCANKWNFAHGVKKTDLGKKQPYEYWAERFGKEQADEMMQDQISRFGVGKKGIFISVKTNEKCRYDSDYERIRIEFLDSERSVSSWTKRHGIRISYEKDGKKSTYIPDILVNKADGSVILEEIKGRIWNMKEFLLKNEAANLFCRERGWRFTILFQKNLKDLP
jgi:hypothetical protein